MNELGSITLTKKKTRIFTNVDESIGKVKMFLWMHVPKCDCNPSKTSSGRAREGGMADGPKRKVTIVTKRPHHNTGEIKN